MKPNEFKVGNTAVRVIKGDITDMGTEAIVNATNSSLMGGGGVDGAIHRRGGPRILKECKQLRAKEWPNGLPTGCAVLTSCGNLKAKYVVHTVGPVWKGGANNESGLLAQAYLSSLKLAVSSGLKSIAFPSISTGTYRYPIHEASRIALRTAKKFIEDINDLDEVVFVLFSDSDLRVYLEAAEEIFHS